MRVEDYHGVLRCLSAIRSGSPSFLVVLATNPVISSAVDPPGAELPFDPNNAVVALCAAGMAIEGTPDEAKKLFEEAWEKRSDDFDAAIAAHYLARHQPSASDKLHWDALAVEHAERVPDNGANEMFPSLYLNLANSLIATGRMDDARNAADKASELIDSLPADGYREFLRMGIGRIQSKLDATNPA